MEAVSEWQVAECGDQRQNADRLGLAPSETGFVDTPSVPVAPPAIEWFRHGTET